MRGSSSSREGLPYCPAMAASEAAAGKPLNVLHLIGSRYNEFYYDLSLLYSRECDRCPDLDRKRFHFHYAIVHLDGQWSIPESLSEEVVAAAPKFPIHVALERISQLAIDVMVPHMFCVEGMTRYRSLFDLLRIPFLGNHEYTTWPATDKATTKQLLEPAGVQVPRGELLIKGRNERPTIIKPPLIVKPCNEDNSRGLSLVKREEDVGPAIEYAFNFDPRIIVDEYIPGREVRAAVIEEEDGSLYVLPKLEYFLDDIRTSAHKLATNDGKLSKDAVREAKKDGDRKCPADLTPEVNARIDEMVTKAHRALKCRHYSLFDLRIHSDTNEPYILEAAFFCSFSPVSVIPSMANAGDRKELHHPKLFHSMLERAAKEKPEKMLLG